MLNCIVGVNISMTTALVKVPAELHIEGTDIVLFSPRRPRRLTKSTKREDPKKKRRKKKRKALKEKKWFSSKTRSGWKKTQPAKIRRKLLLRAHKGSLLSAARSKQALANVTQDEETRVLALKDAQYFFEAHKASKKETR